MRKLPAILLALLLLCTGVLTAAQLTVNSQRDQVVYTETVISGNPSLVEGLTVEYDLKMSSRLLWLTRYDVSQGETDTDFSFFQNRVPEGSTLKGSHFSLNSDLGSYYSALEEDEDVVGINQAWQELIQAAKLYQDELTQTVRLADYYDYYPINGYVSFVTRHDSWDVHSPADSDSLILEAFNDYFRIPMLENQYVELSAYVSQNHGSYGVTPLYEKPDYDWFSLSTSYCMTEDAIYFIFNNRTYQGNIVDTSLIPGGYGVYCLPLVKPDVAQYGYLSTVHSIDPQEEAVAIHASQDGSYLYLITRTGEGLTLTVLDTADTERVQRIPLPGTENAYNNVSQVCMGDDHVLLILDGTRLAPITVGADGSHTLQFVTEPVERSYSDGQLTFSGYYALGQSYDHLWDGERLTFVVSAPASHIDSHYSQQCGFDLVVFDRDGLQFFGHYDSSLNSQALTDPIDDWGEIPLRLSR